MRINGKNIAKFEGIRNVPELKLLLKGIYIRRLQKDVLDLPPMIEREVVIDFKDVVGMKESWEEFEKDSVDDVYATVKMKSANVKAKYTADYCKNLLESGEKPLVIFTAHREALSLIAASLGKYVTEVIHGQVKAEARHDIVTRFQAGKIDVLVCSIKAASVGLNLTRSQNIIFNDLDPNPIYNAQALKRIQRIGQEFKTNAHFIIKGAHDQKMIRGLREKIKTIKQAV